MKRTQFKKAFAILAVTAIVSATSCKHAERDENGSGAEEITPQGPATDPVDSVQDVGSSTDTTSVDRVPGDEH